jgi:hypothetical protein
MNLTEEHQQVLSVTIKGWFRTFGGTSALDIATQLSLEHSAVLRLTEQLCDAGYGTLNRDVKLIQISFDPENIGKGFKHTPVTTHFFFPSKRSLEEAFFASDLPKQNLPEYTTRLHLGAHQIGLVFFSEEVLARYLNHPEHYEINDTLAGGDVTSLSTAPEDRSLYVRYGKSRQKSGQIAITAIYKDLSAMSASEQRYWHSYELQVPDIDETDPLFHRFLSRTYEGDFVDFPDPISDLLEAMSRLNELFAPQRLFTRSENVHLCLPVEQTYKSFCDSASELYKVAGPESVSQTTLKSLLREALTTPDEELMHKESGRPLSTLQLLELTESKLGVQGVYTKPLRKVADYRVEADHKVLPPDGQSRSYSHDFAALCSELSNALASFESAILLKINNSV